MSFHKNTLSDTVHIKLSLKTLVLFESFESVLLFNTIVYYQSTWKWTMFPVNLVTFLSFCIKLSLSYEGKHLMQYLLFYVFVVAFFFLIFFITFQLRDLPKNCLWWRSKVPTVFLLLEGKKWYWLVITFCKTPKSSLWRKRQVCLLNLDSSLPSLRPDCVKWWKHKYGTDIFCT